MPHLIKVNLHSTNDFFAPRVRFADIKTAHAEKDVTGLLLGLGIEQCLCDGLSLNVDYSYIDYGHVSLNQVSDALTADFFQTPLVPVVITPNGVTHHFDTKIHPKESC